MNRLSIALVTAVLMLLGAEGLLAESPAAPAPAETSAATAAGPDCGPEGVAGIGTENAATPALPPGFNCPRYHRCICHCQQEQVCCNNGGGQNCLEEELECFDVCIGFLGPEEQCGVTTCSIDPFCNFP